MSKKCAPLSTIDISHCTRGWCAISDLHLSEDMPQTLAQFELFCRDIASEFDAMFILGDLFEYWVGDDTADINPAALRVINALKTLANAGTQTYFMCGNRDFVLGQAFCERSQMVLLSDPCILTDNGQRILLSHGDLLCTDDMEYQRARAFYTHPWVKGALLRLPIKWRVKLAQHLRQKSRQRWHTMDAQNSAVQDVSTTALMNWQTQYHMDALVHGHTHRAAQHEQVGYTRYVLSDWDCERTDAVRWGYLIARNGIFELRLF